MLIPGCVDAADLLFTEFFEVGHDGPPAFLQCDSEVTIGDLHSGVDGRSSDRRFVAARLRSTYAAF